MQSRFDPNDPELAHLFKDLEEEPDDSDDALPAPEAIEPWRAKLMYGAHGAIRPVLTNACILIRNLPELAGLFHYNELFGRPSPTRECSFLSAKPGLALAAIDAARVTDWIGQTEMIAFSHQIIEVAMGVVAHESSVDPVREYLRSVQCGGLRYMTEDGPPLLSRLFGVDDDDEIAQRLLRAWILGAARRVLEPGCKFDYMLVLEGPQGIGKSRSLRALVPEPRWFREGPIDFLTKDGAQENQGCWIREIGELSGTEGRDINRMKQYISRQEDAYRPPYEPGVQVFPRRVVFAGTTNQEHYLNDSTGGRRFWPIKVSHKPQVDELARVRDAIWAEATTLLEYSMPDKFLDPDWEREVLAPEQKKRLARRRNRNSDD